MAFQPFDSTDEHSAAAARAFEGAKDPFAAAAQPLPPPAADQQAHEAGKPELLRKPSFEGPAPPSPPQVLAKKPSFGEEETADTVPVEQAQTLGQLCVGKLHGECLMRISLRTMLTKSWKLCFWVFDSPDVLMCFREAQHYFDFHKNPYFDPAQRKYITKRRVQLAANFITSPITRKPYGTTTASKLGFGSHAHILYHFTLEEISDLGRTPVLRFAAQEQADLEQLRFAINKRIHKHRVDLVERKRAALQSQAERHGY